MTQVLAGQCVAAAKGLADPFLFFRDYLGIPDSKWTSGQREIIEAVRDNKRVAVASGNALGKSYVACALALWFAYTRFGSKVIISSAVFSQVEQNLFPTIIEMHAKAKRPLGGKVLTTMLKPDAERSPSWMIVGLGSDRAVNFQGRHSGSVFILLDESTGIGDEIFDAIEFMAVAPTDKLLLMCNPLDSTSRMYREMEVPGKWKNISISALQHPNYLEKRVVIPGAMTFELVEELRAQYGASHPLFRSRVLGEWCKELGRAFPEFDESRHVYNPTDVQIDPWHTWTLGADWGFRHEASVVWGRWTGEKMHIVRELVVSGVDSRVLAQRIADFTNPPGTSMASRIKVDALYLGHDSFAKTDSPRSRSDEMGEVLRQNGLPFPIRAKIARIDGWSLIRTMLHNNTLQISSACPRLIAGLRKAAVDVNRPEDVLKEPGDDSIDSLRYLLASNPAVARTPLEIKIAAAVAPWIEKEDYLAAMLTRMRIQDAEKHDGRPFSLGKFLRRGHPL